jgi:hypothetical protein
MNEQELALALTRLAAEITPLDEDGTVDIRGTKLTVDCLIEVYGYALDRIERM